MWIRQFLFQFLCRYGPKCFEVYGSWILSGLFICLFVCLSVCPSVCLWLSFWLSGCVCFSSCASVILLAPCLVDRSFKSRLSACLCLSFCLTLPLPPPLPPPNTLPLASSSSSASLFLEQMTHCNWQGLKIQFLTRHHSLAFFLHPVAASGSTEPVTVLLPLSWSWLACFCLLPGCVGWWWRK